MTDEPSRPASERLHTVQDDVKVKVWRGRAREGQLLSTRRGCSACGTHAFLIWSTVTDAMVTCVRKGENERERGRRVRVSRVRHSAAEAASSRPSQLALALAIGKHDVAHRMVAPGRSRPSAAGLP